ncbi:MAG: NAD(P)/FAD-dependent oxidoreductase [Patescibacteria group bacterium]
MHYDLCIIGAGPAGIEAALQARAAGLSYVLLERFDAGSYIDQTMRNKKFYVVYGTNTAQHTGLLAFPDRVKGHELVTLWKEQVADLNFLPHTTVTRADRVDGGFQIETSKDTIKATSVLLASGTFESRKRLGVEGEEGNELVQYEYDYYTEYEQEDIVVVGGGNSAVETVIGIAEGGVDNTLTLLVRKPTLHQSVTDRNQATLKELVDAGQVTVHYESTVQRIGSDQLTVKVGSATQTLPYHRIFIQIGFESPTVFLEQMGMKVVDGQAQYVKQTFETNVKGLYIAGTLTGADSVVEASEQAMKIVASLVKTRQGEHVAAAVAG